MKSIETRLGRYGYIAGLAGCAVITALGFAYPLSRVLFRDSDLVRRVFDQNSIVFIMVPLLTCGVIMFLVEFFRRCKTDTNLFVVSDKLRNREYTSFLLECLINYGVDLLLVFSVVVLYRFLAACDLQYTEPKFKVWFGVLDSFWRAFLLLAFPCIVVTRICNHDPAGDRKKASYLFFKVLIWLLPFLPVDLALLRINYLNIKTDESLRRFTDVDGKIVLGMMVKLFYAPLMTVFFAENFICLTNNIPYLFKSYLADGITPKGFHDTMVTWIFSVDVGVAWCGYVISTRWLKNANMSVDMTLFGWTVAVLCYPPFNSVLNMVVSVPSETGFLSIPNTFLVWLFTILSVASFVVYMSATLVFGLRFSNLTHRGIITTGAYRFIRHPAYAAKNFSWWCVMMPYVLYEAFGLSHTAVLLQIASLVVMSLLYYFRAITEERHLSQDPDYVAYCRKVPYRFIPWII